MKILYCDPIFGISGDMTLSALIDAGLPFSEIEAVLSQVPLSIPAIRPERKRQGIIEGTHLVIDPSDVRLSVSRMEEIIRVSPVPEKAKEDALSILNILVKAESAVHGVSARDVHFHELSHIDTLIDVLSVAFGISFMGIEEVYCSPIPFGRGTIETAHGTIPNPSPASVEILKGLPVVFHDTTLELTTPTGAAIIRHYVKDGKESPPFTIEKTGYGLGSYDTGTPDLLRVFIGATNPLTFDEKVWIIEADIDDMDMEYTGAVAEKIRSEGALDALFFPVNMKKGRIGIRLSVIARPENLDHLTNVIFSETTTFGLRLRHDMRRTLSRDTETIKTPYGPVRVKTGIDSSGKLVKKHVEFDDVKRCAEERGIPYREMRTLIEKEISGIKLKG